MIRRTAAAALLVASGGLLTCAPAGAGLGPRPAPARPAFSALPFGPGPAIGVATPTVRDLQVGGGPPAPAGAADTGSPPQLLEIPAIRVESRLARLGLNQDGTIQLPADAGQAGWYALGPAPGDPGPSVILGHLDSVAGPAVFARLSALRPGDEILVHREAGTVVRFRVDRVQAYPIDRFPSAEVYGLAAAPELRLITCSGRYNLITHRYTDNLVVYATRTS